MGPKSQCTLVYRSRPSNPSRRAATSGCPALDEEGHCAVMCTSTPFASPCLLSRKIWRHASQWARQVACSPVSVRSEPTLRKMLRPIPIPHLLGRKRARAAILAAQWHATTPTVLGSLKVLQASGKVRFGLQEARWDPFQAPGAGGPVSVRRRMTFKIKRASGPAKTKEQISPGR
ncbi:hypothetical protein CC78DRAFT_123836 [Lojkania enalia]|uniref:Uncharacterized protein n=1 Tax=Lojkania enalia TaxID=147567 RepID=A0A9P4N5Y0_9PLEO|nr:hypothetical protein CC78DRAFT_123836 [Didymosphaeria enalia]